jgi:hypothetical protein
LLHFVSLSEAGAAFRTCAVEGYAAASANDRDRNALSLWLQAAGYQHTLPLAARINTGTRLTAACPFFCLDTSKE